MDLAPPRPHEWLALDLDWWQELVDARNAYDEGRGAVAAEAAASADTRRRNLTMAREMGLVG